MRSLIAAMVVTLLLVTAGCVRPVDEENKQSDPLVPDKESAETWTMKEYPDDPCAHPLSRTYKSRRSPSGRWTIHPAGDEQGTICLVDSQDGSHRALFMFADNVPAEEYQEMIIREGWPIWPDSAFFAGDDSGVYLWYPHHLQKLWYVTVPDGTVHELTSPQFFNNRDRTRMVHVLGSPSGTRDLVIMEQCVDWDRPDLRTYRLIVVAPDGQELTSIVEWETDTWAEAQATPEAVLLMRGPAEEVVVNDTILVTSDVWLYHPSPDGWQSHHLGRLASAGLRRASVTYVTLLSGQPYLVETSPGGSAASLFELPQQVVDATINHVQYQWCISGSHVFFPMSGVLMEAEQ